MFSMTEVFGDYVILNKRKDLFFLAESSKQDSSVTIYGSSQFTSDDPCSFSCITSCIQPAQQRALTGK